MTDSMDIVQQRTDEMLARNIALITNRPVGVSAFSVKTATLLSLKNVAALFTELHAALTARTSKKDSAIHAKAVRHEQF